MLPDAYKNLEPAILPLPDRDHVASEISFSVATGFLKSETTPDTAVRSNVG